MSGKRRAKRVVGADGAVTVHGKNANGEGSVYQTKAGRWVATWQEPGRRYPRQATGKTRDEAIRRRAERQDHDQPERDRTLGDVADWWLVKVYKSKVSIDTWHKAEERLPRIKKALGDLAPSEVDYGTVVDWLADLSKEFKAGTVRNYRQTLALICDEAVKLGLAQGNPVRTTEAPAKDESDRPALEADQVHALVNSARELRLGAAVAILFLQGWRVSEVLGLAWDDIDFDTGKVHLRRISIYRKGAGRMLKPRAKTDATHGEHWLSPTCLELLKIRRRTQAEERLDATHWMVVKCDCKPVDLVFTTPTGGLLQRFRVQYAVELAAKAAGVDAQGLATHGGRRTVVTVLWDEGNEPLDDIAGFVGHTDPKTTEGYVKRRRKRPQGVAKRVAKVLDPAAT